MRCFASNIAGKGLFVSVSSQRKDGNPRPVVLSIDPCLRTLGNLVHGYDVFDTQLLAKWVYSC